MTAMISGFDELQARLEALAITGAKSIAIAMAAGGAGHMTNSIRPMLPQSLQNKIGFSLVRSGPNEARAVVGFGIGGAVPRRGPQRVYPTNDSGLQAAQTAASQVVSSAISAAHISGSQRMAAVFNEGVS